MDLSDALDGAWPAGGNTQAAGGGGGGGGGGLWPGQPNAPTWPGQPTQPNQPTWPGGSAGPAWPGGQPANPAWPQGPSQPSGPWGSGPGPSPGPGPGPTPPVAPQQNLTVPFHQTLPEGAYNKLLITITGTVKPNADKITVDLATARDIAFHFNPRFNEGGKKAIVRNSCIGEKWGREERELQNFPFVPGQSFQMKILCTTTEFKVAINNSHMLDFKHRITNLRDIKKLSIYYDLMLSGVNMETVP